MHTKRQLKIIRVTSWNMLKDYWPDLGLIRLNDTMIRLFISFIQFIQLSDKIIVSFNLISLRSGQ